MKYIIQDLADGKCAVLNDGTVEELREVLRKAFPEDTIFIEGLSKYYYKHIFSGNYGVWVSNEEIRLPIQSVKDFLEKGINILKTLLTR